MADVKLENVSRRFPGGVTALHDLSLDILDGELLAIVGPSGSGKTTLLRVVAGLDVPTSGRVWIGGGEVTREVPWRRNVSLVAESAALLPHATAWDNLAISLRRRRRRWFDGWWQKTEHDGPEHDGANQNDTSGNVTDMLRRLGLVHLGERRPAEWSAGEQQRVALGRALLAAPHVLLMDEPLGRVDGAMRAELARQIRQLQQERRMTCLYVTHDRQEAMSVADRVAVMYRGQIEQVGTPRELYSRPASRYVAQWSGDGRLGWLPARWLAEHADLNAGHAISEFRSNGSDVRSSESRRAAGFRPDAVSIVPLAAELERTAALERTSFDAAGAIDWIEVAGARNYVWVRLDDRADAESHGRDTKSQEASSAAVANAARVVVEVNGQFVARSGDRVRVKFDWSRVQWFEEDSGRNLTVWEKP